MRKATISIAICAMCLALSSGCAAWTDKSKKKDSMWTTMQFWKKPYQKPNKLAAIWTHDILTMSGKPPTRGFGGRLYFYNDKSQAIPVDGELHVHGYEEVRIGIAVQTEKTKADKTFMFTAEQFTEHFSSSDLGASYSIWIPWDAADGEQKEITLIPTFKGKEGTILQGEPAKLVLPGRKHEDPLAAAAFQHVSFQHSQTATNMAPLPQLSGMRTTTISVPAQTNRGASDKFNTGNNANNSSVVIHDSASSGPQVNVTSSNMIYSGSPQAARANAMYAAFTNQAGANGMSQQALMATPQHAQQPYSQYPNVNPPYPSTMPNMLQKQLPQNQFQAVALPQNQYLLHEPGAHNQVSQSPGLQNTSLENLGNQNQSMPNMQPPNMQMPAPTRQLSPQEKLMQEINPGFASTYSPLKPGAVETAFASTPQFQPLAQGPSMINPVQPAAFKSMQPSTTLGQAVEQTQALPEQARFRR